MGTKGTCFLFISILAGLPFIAGADGCVISIPVSESDWTWVGEDNQQAFINYRDGVEKLIVTVDIGQHSSDAVWIVPVPGKPEDVEIDITSDLPVLFGNEVSSKATMALSESINISCAIGALSQLWTVIPAVIMRPLKPLITMRAGGSVSIPLTSTDLISVETHIEKKGMIAEVITAKSAEALYGYLSDKGLRIEQGSIPVLDLYIEKDYVFVVSGISPSLDNERKRQRRGVFITFPTARIYYPLVPTSVYGKKEIPITIRVLGYVRPRIYPEIKPHAVTQYFTKTTRRRAFEKPKITPPPELQKFYGDGKAFERAVNYTRIRINASVELLKEDLWMKARGPLRISLASLIAENPTAFGALIYLFSTAILSFLAGGIVGLICFRRFRKYALIGLANIATLIGFIVSFILASRSGGEEQQGKCSKSGFVCLFSVIFLFSIFLFWSLSKAFLPGVQYIKGGEATGNLAAIRTCQESYFFENGVFIECKPSPPGGGTDSKADPWVDAGGFSEIGFQLDSYVRYQYAVTVTDDGQSYIATATGDIDENGEKAVYTIDSRTDSYPMPIKTGDDY